MKTFSMGMNKDTELLAQPEGTYRDALNINLNYVQGSIVNEEGVARMDAFEDFTICGYTVLDDDRVVMFGNQAITDGSVSQIRVFLPKEDVSITLYEDEKLNFQQTHFVQATHRKNQAGETIVYFTDGYFKEAETGIPSDNPYLLEYNPPRTFNVDKQYERVITFGDPFTRLYGNSRFDADNLRLFPYIGPVATFEIFDTGTVTGDGADTTVDTILNMPGGNGASIKAGGALKCGAYHLALAYEDDEGQTTNYFTMSNPVYISSGPENSIPTTAVTGGTGSLPTNKAITWRVSVPGNAIYSKLKPAVVAINDEVVTAYSLPTVQVNPGSSANEITYTGLEEAATLSVEDILVDDADYLVAQTVSQQNNRLYLGNLKSNKDIGYQGFANAIKLDTVTQKVAQFSPRMYDTIIINYGYTQMLMEWGRNYGQSFKRDGFEDQAQQGSSFILEDSVIDDKLQFGQLSDSYVDALSDIMATIGNETRRGYKNTKFSYNLKGYRRSEIYAFYISFVLKDGTETYAYHIPGRQAMKLNSASLASGAALFEDNAVSQSSAATHGSAYGFNPGEFKEYSNGTRICEVADTTDHTKTDEGLAAPQTTSFWENTNEVYPNLPDFQIIKTVDVSTGAPIVDTGATSLAGQRVRHHKMPSNHSKQVPGYVDQAEINVNYIEEQSLVSDGAGGNRTSKDPRQSVPMKVIESVNILGIRLTNIKIPKYILDNVQGYKIYYAKRKPEDQTVLGQSLAIPAHPRYASAPEQSVVQAKKGPYYRGWYLYGGIRADQRAGVLVSPLWRPRTIANTYLASPVFTFHDFSMMRRKADLTSATHVSAQFGVVFRHFLGGPGQFIPPCNYDKLKYSPIKGEENYAFLRRGLDDADREVTVLPSSGWVSPELRNTVSFTKQEGISGTSYVVDLSDTVKNTSFKLQDGNFDPDANSLENYQLGRITGQEDDDNADQGPSVEAYRLSRIQRVRAYFTGMFVGTAYVNPYDCLLTDHIITGTDQKTPKVNYHLNWEWENRPGLTGGEFNAYTSSSTANFLNLVISPKSLTYIENNSTTKVYTSNSFLGATFLYNRGGESSILIGLDSGLPLLRGHLPRFTSQLGTNADSYAFYGLSRWSESQFFYFPDTPDTSHPYGGLTREFEYQGNSTKSIAHLDDPNNNNNATVYDPESGRGLNFAMLPYKVETGMPMAWLINLCASKTDVFQPFDRQELVWTGYYVSVSSDDTDYYTGKSSPPIFGGDTYISKYNFRTTSQSYGHCHFRLNSRDPGIRNIKSDNTDLNIFAETGYFGGGDTPITDNQGDPNEDIFYQVGQTGNDLIGTEYEEGGYRRDQGDVPLSIGGLSNSYGFTNEQLIWRLNQANIGQDWIDSFGGIDPSYDTRNHITIGALQENNNWVQGTVDPVSSLFEFFVESYDNIELRHSNPLDDSTRFFGTSTAKQIIFAPPNEDLTASNNLLYSEHYSALQDKKVTIPLPVSSRLKEVDSFPIRVARSTIDSGSLADGYRKFKALDYKDIDSNRGPIQNIFSLSGTLYIHTRRAMFMTRGKEELQLSAVNAFIGSGNIFTQDPDEIGQSYLGLGGTDSRYAHITTEHGHFYINRADRAIYSLAGGSFQKISDRGMQTWFRDNLEFALKDYGIDLEGPEYKLQNFYTDSTMATYGIGFTIGYDPKYKRIMITKREPIPTTKFIEDYYAGNIVVIDNVPTIIPTATDPCVEQVLADSQRGSAPKTKKAATTFCGPIGLGNPVYFKQGGWTVSYYPEKGVWGSRHSYLPDLYISTTTDMYSVKEDASPDPAFNGPIRLWKHSNQRVPGGFYGLVYNSEIEFVDNTASREPKLFSSIYYWADSYKENTSNPETDRKTTPGFTSFYVYNSTQISGVGETINYLSNARLVNRMWQLNNFRDQTKTETITSGSLISTVPNTAGGYTTSVLSNQQNVSMFLEEGTPNPAYIDTQKSWFNKAKFMDHYLAIRLITDNSNGNLLHLHGAGANFRKSYR
jgi:hypothetical protein